MDHECLAQLIAISHAVGSNADYVQAGGGNTSVKSPDGRTMAIKASGTSLTSMSGSDGWVELEVRAVLSIFSRTDLPTLPTNEREVRVRQHFSEATVGGRGRPSVESALHAMLGTVVIHTHAVAANALNCGPGEKALGEITPPGEVPPLWIPYTDPGWTLAMAVKATAEAYRKEHGRAPAVLFMENHGLLVSASNAPECLTLHNAWVARCNRYFATAAPPSGSPPKAQFTTLEKVTAELRRIWHEVRGTSPFIRHSDDTELAGLVSSNASSNAAGILASGALTPDHIVYTGAHAVLAESLEELPGKLKPALAEKAPPRLVMIRGVGAFLVADDPAKLDAAEALAIAAAKIVRLASGRGGAHNLKPASADFIINWEAEHYRAGLMDSSPTDSAKRAGR